MINIFFVHYFFSFLLQWGVASDNSTITYPIRFSTVYIVVATTNKYIGNRHDGTPADTCGVIVDSISSTAAAVYKAVMSNEQYNRGNGNQLFSGYWFAIGR